MKTEKAERPETAKADHYDIAILAGFGALVAGMWWVSPPWALIIGGALAATYGLVGSYRKGMGGD